MDSVAQVIHLPPPKFQELLSLLGAWSTKKLCTKRDLLSLIGKFAFAAKVVRSDPLFLHCLIDLSTSVTKLQHHITSNLEAGKKFVSGLTSYPHGMEFPFFQTKTGLTRLI